MIPFATATRPRRVRAEMHVLRLSGKGLVFRPEFAGMPPGMLSAKQLPMTLPRTILVPTDFSECADAALTYAMDLAAVTNGKIVLLHSYLTPVVAFPTGAIAHLPEVIAGIVRNAEAALSTSVARVRDAKIPVESFLKNGDPRDTILQMMGEAHVDLVCMGTHGRRGVARALIGSVAENIVRTSPIPVLTVHRPAG